MASFLIIFIIVCYYSIKTFGAKYINSKIESKFATSLENHKVELQKEAKHQEIQFAKLREVQMPIFNEFNELILKVYKTCSNISFVNFDDPKKFEKRKEMRNKLLDLISTFELKKIYLSIHFAELIEKFIIEMTCVYLNSENLDSNSDEDMKDAVRKQITDACDTKEKIVLEIRKLIGV
jgi:hypothetical protein